MDSLKTQRASCKAAITRIHNWFHSNLNESDKYAFKSRIVNLEKYYTKYSEIQDQIETIAVDTEVEFEDRSQIDEKYYSLHCKLQNAFEKLNPTFNQTNQLPVQSQSETHIRLPSIEIPIFSGDSTKYTSFIDLFNALIVNNTRLTSKTEKFYYLKSYLKGDPLNLISQLPVNETNFDVALDLLNSKYNNTRQIVTAHFNRLTACNNISKCTAQQLRTFTSEARSIVKSLLNLNINKEELFDALIVHILKTKLDYNTKRSLEEKETDHNLIASDTLFDFLEKKCTVLENLLTQDPKPDTSHHRNQSSNVTTPTNRVALIANQHSYPEQNPHYNNRQRNQPSSSAYPTSNYPASTCSFCKETGHKIYGCSQFGRLSIPDRSKYIRDNKMCFRCLGYKHSISNCISLKTCSICQQRHHTLLHSDNPSIQNSDTRTFNRNNNHSYPTSSGHRIYSHPENSTEIINDVPSTSRNSHVIPSEENNTQPLPNLTMLNLNGSHVLLATANILIYPQSGPAITARALLDPGSQNSFICSHLVTQLNGKTFKQPLCVSGICNNNQNIDSMFNLTFYPTTNESFSFETTCAVVKQITRSLPQVMIDVQSLAIPTHLLSSLADHSFGTPSQIDVLLGADIYYTLLKPGIHKLGKNLPTLISTYLGWVISGTVPSACIKNDIPIAAMTHSFHSIVNEPLPTVDTLLEKFWNQEEITIPDQLSEDDMKAETIFTSSLQTLPNGRFKVDLPLIHDSAHKNLGDSFLVAKRRFLSLETRLSKKPQLKEQYKNILFEYIHLQHGEVVPLTLQTPLLDHKYFVPHLCVFKESSSTTKVRIVFDYSAKTSSQISLNDISLKGPRVQPELLDILIRFRNFKYALTADISKMYRQIELNERFRFLQNALWRDSPSDPFICIQLNTVSFGQTSAPFLACRALKEIALRTPQYPEVQLALMSQTYVDDILTGANSVDDLIQLHQNLKSTLFQSGFEIHKVCSNSSKFTNEHLIDSPSEKNLNLDDNPSKVLGITWNPKTDVLQISSPATFDQKLTKRLMLSIISQCFDPLGLVNPVIVQGKLIMQHLWLLKIAWDDPINDLALVGKWQEFVESVTQLSSLHIPRHIFENKQISHIELHGFCDASSVAYGGCFYLRTIYTDSSASSQLIISKSRVAPLNKPITVPKLELCAMALVSKLYTRLRNILDQQLKISSFILWSDSQIALSWIKSIPTRWTVFVCNRVTQIQQATHSATWRHIRSHLNPADILSRGQPLEFPSTKWFCGPPFLWESSDDTSCHDTFSCLPDPPEANKKSLVATAKPPNPFIVLITRSSSLTKLVRAMAYIYKFIDIIRHPANTQKTFSRQNLDTALLFLVRQVQTNSFPNLYRALQKSQLPSDKRLISLNLFIDKDKIIRVGGRLSHSPISYEQKHPILLPARCHFTTLVLQREHIRLGHSGPQNVLANIRLKFWPIDGLREIKRIINKCLMCHRFKAITAQQIMSDLPARRVTPSRPFQTTGVDFAGPFSIKSSHLKRAPVSKSYVALFICFSTKAIHLELVSDLSTDSFIASLKRFTSRRGLPSVIYSDNGTNFVGANHYLAEVSLFLTKHFSPIYDHLLTSSIEWKFIPPRSPHWGGLWEAGVKSVKTHLIKLLATSTFTFEQFSTILTQIEAILNSRPLHPLSTDPTDLLPLTPGHFLIGAPLMALPDKDLSLLPTNRLKFWQQCTHAQQNFWKRWSVDYLNQLQNRPKWNTPSTNLTVGTMVLVKDDDSPPLRWPLARITDVTVGKDGKIRSVQVKTASGTYTRPIVKLIPLPMPDSSET